MRSSFIPRLCRLTCATAAVAAMSASGVALAASAAVPDGGYASSTLVRSPTLSFHVRAHGTVASGLTLSCPVAHPTGALNGELAFLPPSIRLSHGRLSYSGRVRVTHYEVGGTVATATMRLSGRYVHGPVLHLHHGGSKVQARVAFTGTVAVSGSLCGRLPNDGHFKLFKT